MTESSWPKWAVGVFATILSCGVSLAQNPVVPSNNFPAVIIDVSPDSALMRGTNTATQILAIKFDDPFSKVVSVRQPVSVQVEAILGAGTNVPINPARVAYFLEKTEKNGLTVFSDAYKQEGSSIRIDMPGRYVLKAILEGDNVQGGIAVTTKTIQVR